MTEYSYPKDSFSAKTRFFIKKQSFRPLISEAKKHYNCSQKLNILEIGSGAGIFTNILEKEFKNADITSIEIDQELQLEAKTRTKRTDFILGDFNKINLLNIKYDLIFCIQVIEHIEDLNLFVDKLKLITDETTKVIITTPNKSGLGSRLMGNKWMGIKHDHVSLKSYSDWILFFTNYNFRIVDKKTSFLSGLWPFTVWPLKIINYIVLSLFGYIRWQFGESVILVLSENKIESI